MNNTNQAIKDSEDGKEWLHDEIIKRIHDEEYTPVFPSWRKSGTNIPLYMKVSVALIWLIALCYILFILRDILVPFALATLFAVLLNPLTKSFEKYMPRVIAILCSVLIWSIIIWWAWIFIWYQFTAFTDNSHQIQENVIRIWNNIQQYAATHFWVSLEKQEEIISSIWSPWSFISTTLFWFAGLVSMIILLPLYIFLILYYKPLIIDVIFWMFSENKMLKVAEILEEVKWAIQSYISWMLLETIIVSTMNVLLLRALWVKYALLLGIIWGVLNIIPYIWWIVATLLPMAAASLTFDGYAIQIWIVLWYLIIQFLDNNILMPRIVSSKLEINALFSILIVLCWNALWWVAWMFLAIPFIWVLKIILDRIEDWKQIGKLLWTEIPSVPIGEQWQKRRKYVLWRAKKEEKELEWEK